MGKKLIIIFAALLVLIGGVLAFIFIPRNDPQNTQAAEVYSITEGDLPASIRAEMEKVLSSPGVYVFPSPDSTPQGDVRNGQYVLLTAGLVSNYEMGVDYETEGLEHVDFAVSMRDTEAEERYLYRLYFTTASTVTANQAALQNPAMRMGAAGFNQGYLERYGDGYYIIPILDDNITNHVYQAGSVGSTLENGLYEFSYEVTENGTILTSAEQIEQITKKAYVSHCEGNGFVDLVFGTPRNTLTVSYDMGQGNWNRDLPVLADLGAYQTGQYTLGYEGNRVVLKDMQVTMPVLDEIDLGG